MLALGGTALAEVHQLAFQSTINQKKHGKVIAAHSIMWLLSLNSQAKPFNIREIISIIPKCTALSSKKGMKTLLVLTPCIVFQFL